MKKTGFDATARAALIARMERVAPDRAPGWGDLVYRHVDYHLGQFGE